MNIPSMITWFRIVAIPIFVLIFLIKIPHQNIILSAIFIIASITDWLDGYLARRWNQTSDFGAFLDPVADKLLVTAALILLAVNLQHWYVSIAAIVVISREITISALREWMATLGARGVVAVSWIGKWKTFFQMFAIVFLLYGKKYFYDIGLTLLLIATFLTLWSMIQYLFAAWKELKEPRKTKKSA